MNLKSLTLVMVTIIATKAWCGDEKRGEKLFNDRSCSLCHSLGKEGTATSGPNLAGVTKRQNRAWLERWIKSPDLMLKDPDIQKMAGKYSATMPNMALSDAEVDDLISYFEGLDGKVRAKKKSD